MNLIDGITNSYSLRGFGKCRFINIKNRKFLITFVILNFFVSLFSVWHSDLKENFATFCYSSIFCHKDAISYVDIRFSDTDSRNVKRLILIVHLPKLNVIPTFSSLPVCENEKTWNKNERMIWPIIVEIWNMISFELIVFPSHIFSPDRHMKFPNVDIVFQSLI